MRTCEDERERMSEDPADLVRIVLSRLFSQSAETGSLAFFLFFCPFFFSFIFFLFSSFEERAAKPVLILVCDGFVWRVLIRSVSYGALVSCSVIILAPLVC